MGEGDSGLGGQTQKMGWVVQIPEVCGVQTNGDVIVVIRRFRARLDEVEARQWWSCVMGTVTNEVQGKRFQDSGEDRV